MVKLSVRTAALYVVVWGCCNASVGGVVSTVKFTCVLAVLFALSLTVTVMMFDPSAATNVVFWQPESTARGPLFNEYQQAVTSGPAVKLSDRAVELYVLFCGCCRASVGGVVSTVKFICTFAVLFAVSLT